MRKLITILFCIFAIGSQMNAQVFYTNAVESTHDMDWGSNLAPKQKMLHYKETHHVLFTQSASGENSFVIIEQGGAVNNDYVMSADIPDYFDVKDFAILGDTLYFCGSVIKNYTNTAFLAYTSIPNLLDEANSGGSEIDTSNITYTLIDTMYQDKIYSINRIEAFYDTTNAPVVAGIGNMHYGEPPYLPFGVTSLDDPDEYELDFFMIYRVNPIDIIVIEPDNSTIGGTIITPHQVNRTEMYYMPNDTVNNSYCNKFVDIVQTNKYVYVISADYSDVEAAGRNNVRSLNLFRFIKSTMEQTSYKVQIPFEIKPEYGVRVNGINDDILTIACEKPDLSTGEMDACVLKVNFSINTISACRFDRRVGRPSIIDAEYIPATNELVVLRNVAGGMTDYCFHVSLNDNLSYPYSLKITIMKNQLFNVYVNWEDLMLITPNKYFVSGYKDRYLVFHNHDANTTVGNDCSIINSFNVYSLERPVFRPANLLNKCSFSTINGVYEEGDNPENLSIPYYDFIILYKDISRLYHLESYQNCQVEF